MPKRASIQCPNCRAPITALIDTIIDPAQDPQAKVRLLTGRVNTVQCPNCGTPVTIASPILYHDASKELLLTLVPMELNLTKDSQEKAIGDLMRELTARLPKEAIKGYLFQPRQMLTLQGMIDAILQADGVTPEMMEEQRERVKLIERLLATPEELLPSVVQENDARIDQPFLQTLALMAQQMEAQRQMETAERLYTLQERLMELSTIGQQILEESARGQQALYSVSKELEALAQDENAAHSELVDMAIRYADDDMKLQALVGLARPAMDYVFFQELSKRIENAPVDQRAALEALRERLSELTRLVDQQVQSAVQGATSFLQLLLDALDPDQLLRENLQYLDETFLSVLGANLQDAERRGDLKRSSKLRALYDKVMALLQEQMPRELRFINVLLSQPSEEASRLLHEQGGQYGEALLETMDRIGRALAANNGDRAILEKLTRLRKEAETVLR